MNATVKKSILQKNLKNLDKVLMAWKESAWNSFKLLFNNIEKLDDVTLEIAKFEISSKLNIIAKLCDKKTLEKDLTAIIDK